MGAMESSKYWIRDKRGAEKISILIGRSGIMGGRSKNGGGSPFQSNFGATKDA